MPDPTFDYESTLEACARQDERAFQALYKQEAPQMLGLAITLLGQRDQAEDCLHDAFVQIWRNAGRFQRSLGSGRAWIYSILRYRALNQLRSRGRLVEMDDDFIERAADDSAQAADLFERQAESRQLRDCLRGLERKRRHPILLAFYRGLTHDQIATRLTIPLGTIKARIRVGLRALQECLQA
ncbi:sigma-70 family RNA polymerase sigma factor [Pseudomonas sp. GD03944]|uniref:sigma-70 family RNA polymerase sigma factor n=1 Tax=Pseudomonas sp. GD03944 TaxID=2975409 RepID=UPI00244BAEFA|nr:sigma-70 family RNA polymerase sigma factor [Pseudomonas sp. GD03944]MDH1262808.1 sigma-70 family RNA polymerase sigma factor [Pseudomonas sp. GD03944]